MSLVSATALELADRIARREVSSEEVTRAFLDRVERHDPAVGAFVQVWPERALAEARAADARVRRGGPLPPFLGVPTGVKDLDIVAWSATRFGTRALPPVWSPVDGPVARRMRAGGFVLLGKLATSEFGALPVTEPDGRPPTRNPWNLARTAGGSSGGSAAAVTARMLPIAQGSDGGGSIRIPASFGHLFGFKPSRARVPNLYGAADQLDLASVGPLARSVEDAAAMTDVLAGHGNLRREARMPPGRLRVRFATDAIIGEVDPAIAAATRVAAGLLSELGHEVVEEVLPAAALDDFLPVWQRQVANAPALLPGRLQPVTRWLRDEGRRYDHARCVTLRDDLRTRIREWFGDADLWLLPTVPVPPPEVGVVATLPPEAAFRWAARLGPNTAPFNVTGQPAASVPFGFGPDGLPVGVQLVGRPEGDAAVLAVSHQLEVARPFRDPCPEAFA